MNNHILTVALFCFLLSGFVSNVSAQNTIVKGTVTNAENGDPVEFANIGIESTYLGTATNMDGYFEMELSKQLNEKSIRISAVGFKTKSYLVKDWMQQETIKILLTPVYYGISEVNIEAKSKIGYGIIRSASNLILDNYIQSPHTYKCYLHSSVSHNKENKQSESLFLLSDSEGYRMRSFTNAFQNRNYKIIERLSDEKSNGLTVIDQLINQDVVRCAGNILSVESINDFNIEVLGSDEIEGESVWVIEYNCKNPSIQNSGDPELIAYKGEIWISKNNNAILKNSIQARRKGYFIHGNSFKNIDSNQKEVVYKTETTYTKKDNVYVLNSIIYILSDAQENIQEKVFLKVVELSSYDNTIINRQYYNDTEIDSVFWSKYNRPIIK